MKRVISIAVILGLLGVFAWTLFFLYSKSQAKPVRFEVGSPKRGDITLKTVATGAIVPRKEIELKPRVSGIISRMLVEPGNIVQVDQLIAEIEIVPDTARLSEARARVKAAELGARNATNELNRARQLRAKGIMPQAEFNRIELDDQLKAEELAAAIDNLQVIKKGASRTAGAGKNTEVRSTVAGMVLDVPFEAGMSVIESNNFNAGSTIATIADMSNMVFEGQVDESEVGKIQEGMKLKIRIGAVESAVFDGTLEFIAPKGVSADGAIQFQIRASIEPRKDVFIRAGYSANADIVLDQAKDVLMIDERFLQFDDGKPYVEVEVAPQKFERRDVSVGLSDGLNIAVESGLTENDRLKGRER